MPLHHSPLRRAPLLACLLGLLCSVTLQASQEETAAMPAQAPLAALLQSRLEQHSGHDTGQLHWSQLNDFYAARDYLPAWVEASGPNAHAALLLQTLQQAGNEGLEPAHYQVLQLEQLWHRHELAQLLDLELLLSNAFFDYSRELHSGQLDPKWSELLWHITVAETDSVALLQALLASDDFAVALRSLPPTHPAYRRLREALARYRKLAASGDWPTIPEGEKLRLGGQDLRVPLLRRRLQLEGELQFAPLEEEMRYDQELRYAVERFQLRHGLKADGVVGPLTLAELNVPLRRRIAQIKLNMERWRWLPEQLGHRHIIINVSAFQLTAYDHGERQFTMDTIIGTLEHPTPLITGRLHTVVFNPFWNIPQSIALEEVIPRAMREPDYLTSRGIRVFANRGAGAELPPSQVNWSRVSAGNFPYLLRQDPGPKNPLGKMKFVFTNNYRVYLHDTPQQRLFEQMERAYSHGCIRVAEPSRLASYLLASGSASPWNDAAIRTAVNSGTTREVAVATPVPVYLLYLTAWVGEDGAMHFRRDIYGEDEILLIDLPQEELKRDLDD